MSILEFYHCCDKCKIKANNVSALNYSMDDVHQ